MARKNKIRPEVVGAGVAVVGGVIFFSWRKRRRCKKLPKIWAEEGPIHLTNSTQDEVFDLTEHKIREYALAGEEFTVDDITMAVANELKDCDWSDRKTVQQREAWSSIKLIVKKEIELYQNDPDLWMDSMEA